MLPGLQQVIVKLRAYPLPPKKSYLFTDTVLKNVYPSSWWESIDPTNEHTDMCVIERICCLLIAVSLRASVEWFFSDFGLGEMF